VKPLEQQLNHGLLYLTRKNEIIGYNLSFDLVKARRQALGGPFAGMMAKFIHIYPLEASEP
jgi:hypothetical protein